MAANDPYHDLELLADDKFLALEGDFLSTFPQWDGVSDNQRLHTEDPKYYSEPMQIAFCASGPPPNVGITSNMLLQDYLTPTDSQQNAANPVYFHPGIDYSSNSNSGNEIPPSVASYQMTEDGPNSVRAPKSRDRARHREVEQKYRNRINSKMDELCALLTPDGKPQMQKWTALDNAIKLIKYLRRQNEFLRNDSANLRAQVYTLQCALNRSMGVDFVPGAVYPPEQQQWHSIAGAAKASGSSSSSPGPSLSNASDDIPVQKARINVYPSPPSYSPSSPSVSVNSSSPYSDGSNGVPSQGANRHSPNFLSQPTPAPAMPLGKIAPVGGAVMVKKVPLTRPAPAATAAIPQGKTVLACVLFSVLFFWNPFIAGSQTGDAPATGYAHHGHDHGLERVYDYGNLDTGSTSFASNFQWLTPTYIVAAMIHVLLFLWLVARIFVLPEEIMSTSSETEKDIDTDVKQHIRCAHDHIANGHYSAAFEQLSTACSIMGHPLPQTSLDVGLSFSWAVARQLGHICRIGTSLTVWMVQFLADGPLQPTILHRRLTTCASIQQRIVKLAVSGKIDLPVCTRLSLALSSISLQETAYALASTSCSDRHWHQLLEDSYITAGIFILQLPLPLCFFARYYFFQASSTAKLFGLAGDLRRFAWLYGIDSSAIKDLVSLASQSESKEDASSQAVFFECTNTKRSFIINEPWSRMAWLRSRELLTELLSCLTLSVPASSATSFPKSLRSRSVDSISEYCLGELEEIEKCLRGGTSSASRLGSWIKLFRGCQAWRRSDQEALNAFVESMMKDKKKLDDEEGNPTCSALQFALVASSLLPNTGSRYQTIQRLLRAASALLESNLHEDPDDIVQQFCRLMAAEIALSCRLHLVSRYSSGNCGDKRGDLSQAESCMTVYLVLLDRMAPNHPRALMYRSRVALAAGENPIVAERFAKAALAITMDATQARVRFGSPNQSSANLLSAEAVLLLTLIRSKFSSSKSQAETYAREREALQQALISFKQENSPALAHLCSQLIGVE